MINYHLYAKIGKPEYYNTYTEFIITNVHYTSCSADWNYLNMFESQIRYSLIDALMVASKYTSDVPCKCILEEDTYILKYSDFCPEEFI